MFDILALCFEVHVSEHVMAIGTVLRTATGPALLCTTVLSSNLQVSVHVIDGGTKLRRVIAYV